ncbi:MAG: glycosyltransferase family 2 protein [Bacillota bacterium]
MVERLIEEWQGRPAGGPVAPGRPRARAGGPQQHKSDSTQAGATSRPGAAVDVGACADAGADAKGGGRGDADRNADGDDGGGDDASTDADAGGKAYEAGAGACPLVYRYRVHTSAAAARNEGIRLARGALLIFLDSDIVTRGDFVEAHVKTHIAEAFPRGRWGGPGRRGTMCVRAGLRGVPSAPSACCRHGEQGGASGSSRRGGPQGLRGSCRDTVFEARLTAGRPDEDADGRGNDGGDAADCGLTGAGVAGDDLASVLNSSAVIVHGRVVYTTNLDRPTTEPRKLSDVSMAFFASGNVSIARRWIVQAGLFDEDFTEYGWEDLELGKRLKKLGLRVVRSDAPTGYHLKHEFRAADLPAVRRREIERGHMAVLYVRKHPTFSVRMTTMIVRPFFWLVAVLTPGGWPDRPGAANLLDRLQCRGHRTLLGVVLQIMVYYWYVQGIKEALAQASR